MVGSTSLVRWGGEATGARPAGVYCTWVGAAAEYCTVAGECVVASTSLVRWGGEATRLGPRECTVHE